jgi:hypothetical protein
VIAADSDAVYQKLEQELRGGGRTGVFYLTGGLAEYRQHVMNQIVTRAAQDKPAKLPACQS